MPKIMLVEDDNNLREIYGERLMAEGYDIVSASDGEEALALAVKENPDLIISDVMMPKISGFDMLDILRQTPETKDTKVIMMTALSQSEDKDRADKLGADKYLVKSQVTLEDVARVVHDLVYGPDDSPGAEASAGPETATQEPAVVAPSPLAVAPEVVEQPTEAPVVAVEPVAVVEPAVEAVAPAPVAAEPAVPTAMPFDVESMVVEPASTTVDNIVAASTVPSDNEGEPVVLAPAVAEPTVPVAVPTLPSQDFTVPDLSAAPSPVVADPVVLKTEPEVVPASTPEPVPVAIPEPVQAVANPILGDQPQPTDTIPAVSSAEAQTTEDETAQIAAQIQSFVSSQPEAPAQHESPLVEPTEQELIHAQNAVEDPEVLQPAVDAGIAATNSDPTVPQVVPSDDSNPEPAGARKKIISPINDPTNSSPNIYELYEKEMAEEAANSPVQNPGAGSNVDAENNPIVGTQADEPPAALETIDTSLIEGLTFGEEQPLPTLPESRTMAQAPTPPLPDPITPENPEEPAPDPNDPNSFAL